MNHGSNTPLTADQSAMAERHFGLAVEMAGSRIGDRSVGYDERRGACVWGLMLAVRRFDAGHPSGCSFRTYAFQSMRSSMVRASRTCRVIHIPEQFWHKGHPGMDDATFEAAGRLVFTRGLSHPDGDPRDVADGSTSPDWDREEMADRRDRLRPLIEDLPTQERLVIKARMRGLTQVGIAAGFGITRQRVQAVEAEAVRRLKVQLRRLSESA